MFHRDCSLSPTLAVANLGSFTMSGRRQQAQIDALSDDVLSTIFSLLSVDDRCMPCHVLDVRVNKHCMRQIHGRGCATDVRALPLLMCRQQQVPAVCKHWLAVSRAAGHLHAHVSLTVSGDAPARRAPDWLRPRLPRITHADIHTAALKASRWI